MSVVDPIWQHLAFSMRGHDANNPQARTEALASYPPSKDYAIGLGIGTSLGALRHIAIQTLPKQRLSALSWASTLLATSPASVITLGAVACALIVGHACLEYARHRHPEKPIWSDQYTGFVRQLLRVQTTAAMSIGLAPMLMSLYAQPACLAAILIGEATCFGCLHQLLQTSQDAPMASAPFLLGTLGVAAAYESLHGVGLSLALGFPVSGILHDVVLSVCLRSVFVGLNLALNWVLFDNVPTDYLQSFRVADAQVGAYRFEGQASTLPPTIFDVPDDIQNLVHRIKSRADAGPTGLRSWSGLPILTLQAPAGHGKYAMAAGLANALDGALFYTSTERLRAPELEELMFAYTALNAATMIRQAEIWARKNQRTAVVAISNIEQLLTPTHASQSESVAARQFANTVIFEEALDGFSGYRTHIVFLALTEHQSAPFEDMLAAFTARRPIGLRGTLSATGMQQFVQTHWNKAYASYLNLGIDFSSSAHAQHAIQQISDLARTRQLCSGQVEAALQLADDAVRGQFWRQSQACDNPMLFTKSAIAALLAQPPLPQPQPAHEAATCKVILEHLGMDTHGSWLLRKFLGSQNYVSSIWKTQKVESLDPILQSKNQLILNRFLQGVQFSIRSQGAAPDAKLAFHDLQPPLPTSSCLRSPLMMLGACDDVAFVTIAQKTWSTRWQTATWRWLQQQKVLGSPPPPNALNTRFEAITTLIASTLQRRPLEPAAQDHPREGAAPSGHFG